MNIPVLTMLGCGSKYLGKTKRCNDKSATQKKAMPCRKVSFLSGRELGLIKQINPSV